LGLKLVHSERDKLLVQKALGGSQKAYTKLMYFYWGSIEAFFASKLSSKEDVEDLSIATFSKAFDKLSSFDYTYAFNTWIRAIASNTLIDFFRKKDQKTISIDQENPTKDLLLINLIDSALDPEHYFIQKQKNKNIARLVHRLKPNYRELIILRYLDELTYSEISEKLNMPLGSVKAKLFRARELLLNILKNHEDEY
jgi:RNA polymerase sigma-70 factor (ECF subfamily)